MKKGFTLIELLIVVAIIAILAAIAIPNFLEAQTRAKVARSKADLRTLATAVETYAVDYNKYPTYHYSSYPTPWIGNNPGSMAEFFAGGWTTASRGPGDAAFWDTQPIWSLTTPIPYITTMMDDIFHPIQESDPVHTHTYMYVNWQYALEVGAFEPDQAAMLIRETGLYRFMGAGPDKFRIPHAGYGSFFTLYDPTNGTVSWGNILRTQKEPSGVTGLP